MKNLFSLPFFLIISLLLSGNHSTSAQQYSLRFYGNGYQAPGADRIKIPLDNPSHAVDVSKNFTIEFWMKADYRDNNGKVKASASNGGDWAMGNTIVDRNVHGAGDYGDYGLSIGSYAGGSEVTRVIAFGIAQGEQGVTVIGKSNVADNQWHHIAVTRNAATGIVKLYVNGTVEAMGMGPKGKIGYRDRRLTDYPETDPYLVIGANKSDVGPNFPSYNGYIDEMRICKNLRYNINFTPIPVEFGPDTKTVAIYHFNEGGGSVIYDKSKYLPSPSDGTIYYGGSPLGPVWSFESPLINSREEIENKENGDLNVAVYPNPNDGHFQVIVPENNMLMVVTDLNGIELYRQKCIGAGTYNVGLPVKVSGLYLLVIQNEAGEKQVRNLIIR
ncbi:MAG: T9SS type A sorting domain-containing protein [Chitinophagales bacterium]|nr:T9SS type A sorting domain-containing protein [Chitinophagales bacterium]